MDEIGEVKNTVKHNSDTITKEQYPVLNEHLKINKDRYRFLFLLVERNIDLDQIPSPEPCRVNDQDDKWLNQAGNRSV